MDELHAQRRLLKSPPELWAEVSDEEALARHLGPFGQIRITRREPERTVAWEGDRASGTVELDPTGWGTRVTVRATPEGEPARWGDTVSWLAPEEEPWADAPAREEPEAEPVVAEEPPAPEPDPEPEPERPGFWARLFGRRRPAPPLGPPIPAVVQPEPEPEPEPEPAPVPAAVQPPEVEPVVHRAPPVDRDAARRVLADMLEHLGTAHHRPFSRG